MQNSPQNRIIGMSHFFLAIGIGFLSLLAMIGLAYVIVPAIWGISVIELTEISIDNLTVSKGLALKFVQFLSAFGFVIAGFVCAKTFRFKFTNFVGLNNSIKPILLVLGLLLLFSAIPLIDVLVTWNDGIELPARISEAFRSAENSSDSTYLLFLKHNTGIHLMLNLLIMSVLAAVGEEIFFRGILLRVIANWTNNVHIGIWVSAILFSIMHFQPYKLAGMISMAVLFGYIYYRTRSLWVPIILHAVNNATIVFIDWYEKKGHTDTFFSESAEFPVYGVIISLVLFIGLGYIFWRKTKHSDFSYE